uniref:Methyltransferase n=1 Tax=Iridovirus LCIVAC01 TaxID=2506607 RepID=A0A481YS05_9VIRU|nr:MAG: methyltransferase [Iridovirus LCIVAC01]
MESFTDEKLKEISESPTTELCRIMHKYGSDKSLGHHNYTKLYDNLFSERRNEKLTVLEIGIGSINPSIPSNMTGQSNYLPGASIRGWREYFPNAHIYCCDIDLDVLDIFENDDNIQSFYLDQTNPALVNDVFNKSDLKDIEFDIIIDDGLHNFPINYMVLEILYPKLKKGGYYIVEDIINYNKSIVMFNFSKYVTLPNPRNNVDNNLFIVKKTS